RRSVRVRLTDKGREIRLVVARLFAKHADGLMSRDVIDQMGMDDITSRLRRLERYWTDQIRYIY
ncbi:MAG: MarR family transcriptional regulator, partial [Paracoccaceae bacterium]